MNSAEYQDEHTYYTSPRDVLLNVIDETSGTTAEGNGAPSTTEENGALAGDGRSFKHALEAAGIGEWAWDLATGQVDLSPKAAEIFGVAGPGAIDGVMIADLLHPDDASLARELSEQSLRTGRPYEAIFRLRGREGQEPPRVVSRGKVLFSQAGEPMLMYGIVAPLTERSRMAAANGRDGAAAASDALVALEQTFDAMGSAVLMLDRFGCVIGMSDAARSLVAASAQISLRGARLICHDETRDLQLQAALALSAKAGSTYRERIRLDGDRTEVMVFPVPPTYRRAAELGIAALVSVSRCELPAEKIYQLAESLGLTRAERAIVDLILDGQDPASIAALRQTSRETIRVQLKSIHAKAGVNSRAALVKLFLDMR
jgi:PAS domain-containing protein